MSRVCAACGAQVADTAGFCAACGKSLGQRGPAAGYAAAPAPIIGSLPDNIAGLLAYVIVIPAIVFLVMEPYNKRPFVRFHSFQCLFLAIASLALGFVVMILGMIPFVGFITLPLAPIVCVLVFLLFVICLLKAYQGQMWKVPIIGDLAEQQANAI